jgi:hypothetical protein
LFRWWCCWWWCSFLTTRRRPGRWPLDLSLSGWFEKITSPMKQKQTRAYTKPAFIIDLLLCCYKLFSLWSSPQNAWQNPKFFLFCLKPSPFQQPAVPHFSINWPCSQCCPPSQIHGPRFPGTQITCDFVQKQPVVCLIRPEPLTAAFTFAIPFTAHKTLLPTPSLWILSERSKGGTDLTMCRAQQASAPQIYPRARREGKEGVRFLLQWSCSEIFNSWRRLFM